MTKNDKRMFKAMFFFLSGILLFIAEILIHHFANFYGVPELVEWRYKNIETKGLFDAWIGEN